MSLSGPSVDLPDSDTFGQDASFHLEQPIGSMTISPSGRDVALASKDGLHIIDLDSPYSPPRYLPHRTPWEVADVQWSPFAVRDYWVVSTSNQKALVWNLEAKSWESTIQFVLHAHTRAITDINFAAHDPDLLATCAVDSFVHCWDLRAHARPAFSFSDWFAGATQVKWNRKDEHILASSHDKFLHIWDKRHGARPMRSIEAHCTKIYGVDWNRFEPHKVVTCSLDRTVKFWDTESPQDEPERVINTPFPVWRARHTPFGWGLMAMPQRGSGDLFLYDRRPIDGVSEDGRDRPVARFSGHTGQVKEFLWRAQGTPIDNIDHRDFQLISWGTDRELRLHRIDTDAMEGIGYEKGVSNTHRLQLTRRGARYRTFRDLNDESSSPIDPPSRTDSHPSQHQMLPFRKRTSTAVGMSKVHVSQIRGWASRENRQSPVAMHGRGTNHQDINPIAWLKNVKIASWDPDTLAEEIRHVGEKFKKVEFETVDIKHRKLVMSLQAPWSEHQNAVYLRVDIKFPKPYPREANAVISVQKTGNLEEEMHVTLTKELHAIAEVYASQRRGCLEAVLRYLLREQSLEQIVTWVMGESVADSKIIDPALIPEDDSSDSDDDNLQGLDRPLAASANVRVPLAKGCGALWSENGTLVCFFPPKKAELDSVFGTLSLQRMDKSESSRLFEGFGRIHTDSPSRKPTSGNKTADDDTESDSSDSLLSSSSSSSSSSSEPGTDLQGSILPYHKSGSGFAFHHSRSIDHSNRSTTMAGAKITEGPRRSVLSLQRYDDLLPSNKDLASSYRVFGPGQEVCEYNAGVAIKSQREDLSSVWNLAGMILSRNVPLDLAKFPQGEDETQILVVARRMSSRLQRKDSGVELHNGKSHESESKPLGRAQLRWGNSPLAAKYLVPAMFDYFDRIGDIQMLAMLSCIFANSSETTTNAKGDATLFVGKATNTTRFYASELVAKSLLGPQPGPTREIWVAEATQPQLNRMLSSPDEQALRSRRATTVSMDPSGGYRYESSSQHMSRAPSISMDDGSHSSFRSAAMSLSTSPEGNRLVQRASTSGALSTAQASLSALTHSFSHSPPLQSSMSGVASSLKKYSPSSSLTPSWGIFSGGHGPRSSRPSVHYSESSSQDKETNLRSSASLANIRSLRRDGRLTPDTTRRSLRSVAPSDTSDSTRRIEMGKPRRKILKSTLYNQDQFDLDNYASVPLLDTALEEKYKGYRASYAQLLEVWQLPVQRAEILKIDGLTEDESSGSSPVKRARRKTLLADDQRDAAGLRIHRCCQSCGNVLAAIEKNGVAIGWHCIDADCSGNKRKVSKKSVCSICYRGVDGLSVPCLQCCHLTCYDCGQEWFGQRGRTTTQRGNRRHSSKSTTLTSSNPTETLPSVLEEAVEDVDTDDDYLQTDDDEERTCPTGCGCPCPTVHVTVPIPPDTSSKRTSLNVPLQRTVSQASTNSSMSHIPGQTPSHTIDSNSNTPDSTLSSFFGLSRKPSSSATAARTTGPTNSHPATKHNTSAAKEKAKSHDAGDDTDNNDSQATNPEKENLLLNPWADSRIASLGRGIGGGLSRGLRERGSDSTIRQV